MAGGKGDPLAVLAAIDTLEVGSPRVEPDRVTAVYTVGRGGTTERTELSYKFEEAVFDPSDPGSLNLAALMCAQVAMNYGLFCRRIVLRGLLDAHDRRFIEEMTRHTAREIFVKKILEPNPFLTEPAHALPPVRADNFLRARLEFPDALADGEVQARGAGWQTDPGRHVLLSSGGKDSLLTFGLLDEMGRDVHPVFVNESGRHWYTALNAYRHFGASVPQTARVWTNADRVFSWMLRQLPFIRPDFASVRSDEYPVRLWTVAVFIFGALPLARKRAAGRILIGDEFDTTVRTSHKGITHYDGLYDQSRYFDSMMSRYFGRKRWGLVQFSMLRPLSELLIEKVLVARYPELQRHQVSCHAASLDEGRAVPCGRCEKCRRIVGMLAALGADPAACGYSADQARLALEGVGRHGLHQEAPGREHLLHLLRGKGLLDPGAPLAAAARPHPEILKLRFDPERSPVDAIPVDLRGPLYRILLEHADGAVRRSGKVWIDFDPLSEASLSAPFRFERPAGTRTSTGSLSAKYMLSELTWQEAEARLREVDVALLPVGAIEQHGPHLPLDVDAYDVAWLCRRVAEECSVPRPIVLPLIPFGVSYHHADFAGTMGISPETLAQLVYEVGMSASQNGVTKLVIVNGHGGNSPALQFAAQKINRDARIFTCVDTGETSDAEVEEIAETPNDVHAGEIETSTTLALRPELVKMDLARPSVPSFSSEYLNFSSKKGVQWFARTRRLSKSGVLGDPTKASREKGERMWAVIVRNLVRLVEDLKSMSLDEIHERRY
jgi:creatinine amidohydrolase/Fe(II)-dependent formamide hydrolase-like protein